MNNPWDERYSNSNYVYGKQPNDFLKQHLNDIPMGKILSLAEGEGRNAVFLAKHGRQVTAVDYSSIGLEKAVKLAKENSVTITPVRADLNGYKLDVGTYDGIVSIYCHVPPHVRKALFSQLAAAIKPGGVFLMESYTPAQIGKGTGGPPTADLTTTLAEMKNYLKEFEIIHGLEMDREVVEGELHNGIASVLQIIAKRN